MNLKEIQLHANLLTILDSIVNIVWWRGGGGGGRGGGGYKL